MKSLYKYILEQDSESKIKSVVFLNLTENDVAVIADFQSKIPGLQVKELDDNNETAGTSENPDGDNGKMVSSTVEISGNNDFLSSESLRDNIDKLSADVKVGPVVIRNPSKKLIEWMKANIPQFSESDIQSETITITNVFSAVEFKEILFLF